MSSSRSGPVDAFAIADQFPVRAFLDIGVCQRGNQAKGTEIVRPSDRSTVKASSVSETAAARGVVEATMPRLHQQV